MLLKICLCRDVIVFRHVMDVSFIFFLRWRVAGLRCNGVSLRARTACEGAQRGTLLPRRSALSRLAAAAWRLLLPLSYAAWRPCCGAAAELPALCAAETCSWFAAARGVATGVCATRAILLCGNRKPVWTLQCLGFV